MSPSNAYSSKISTLIGHYLLNYVLSHKLGHVTGEQAGYMVAGDRYAPNVAYVSKTRQPELLSHGYCPNPPELAVEVIPPTDRPHHIRIKVGNYLAVGTTVWVVNPASKTVEVYVPGQKMQLFDEDGTLDGGEVLPGFTLAVAALFEA